jgi:negative regulator of sigma-B (phosphoserine phosphatase)
VKVGAAMRPKAGEVECGDGYVVRWMEDGVVIAVIDGLGHGREAAHAARRAREYIENQDVDSLSPLMHGLHQAMTHTRGAAVALLRFRPSIGEMSHCAVGNVEVVGVFQEEVQPLCTPGIVGYNVRRVVERTFPVRAGDVVVVHTDGVSRRFDLERYQHLEAQALAEAVLSDWGKDHDDATCVSVRC